MHHLDIHLYFVHFVYLYPHLLFLVYVYNTNYIIIALYHGNSIEVNIMKRKIKQWWSTIPPISTKRKIISHLKSLSIKKTLPYDVENLGRYIWICEYSLLKVTIIDHSRKSDDRIRQKKENFWIKIDDLITKWKQWEKVTPICFGLLQSYLTKNVTRYF
jgi:hypothetical protein